MGQGRRPWEDGLVSLCHICAMRKAIATVDPTGAASPDWLYMLGVCDGIALVIVKDPPCDACRKELKHIADTIQAKLSERFAREKAGTS